MWFEDLLGFSESSPEQVRDNIIMEGTTMRSKINGRIMEFGSLDIPTLQDLKALSLPPDDYRDLLKVSEIVGDVQKMHSDPGNRNAIFQAASQFNLLEMVNPEVSPEAGVGIYEKDFTQGPACAIACGAGTIYRNYFMPLDNQLGQTHDNQVDCLRDVGKALNNEDYGFWEMVNGYAMLNEENLSLLDGRIRKMTSAQREGLKDKLRVGIQWNTEVTLNRLGQKVSQVYCSALPVAYLFVEETFCEAFARLILEATYEACLHAALINYDKTSCNKVFLTLVGGGAFGNDMEWIVASLHVALTRFKNTPLDVRIVSYGRSKDEVRKMVREFATIEMKHELLSLPGHYKEYQHLES